MQIPKRPQDPNPLFRFVEAAPIIKGRSPIEAQRDRDGTPHTRIALNSKIRAQGPKLSLDSLKKSATVATEEKPKLDADEVVKAFLRS